MSNQLSIAAAASALALAALCLNAPVIDTGGEGGTLAPIAVMADLPVPSVPLPSLFRR